MPTPTYTALATVTLASASASVTFSSIPATYRDLILVMNYGQVDSTFAGKVYLNADTTGANYTRVMMAGNGSSTSSNANGGSIRWEVTGTANKQAIIQIMDYSATDKHKTALVRSGDSSTSVEASANRWANTAAVTSVLVQFGTNLTAGSTLNLFGVIA
jgi:hypothetical protein